MTKVIVQSQYSNLAGVYGLEGDDYKRADGKAYLYRPNGANWVFGEDPKGAKYFVESSDSPGYPWKCKSGSFGEAIESIRQLEHKDSSKFPKRLYVKSKYGNIDGGYTIMKDLYEEYPAYINKEDDLCMWHSAVGGSWKITPLPPGSNSNYALCKGDTTNPALLDFNQFADQTVESIEVVTFDEAKDINDGKYVDSHFLPTLTALGLPKYKEGDVEWIRAANLNRNDPDNLFYLVEPTDLLQGSVGDCWLMSAIAGVAEYPDLIKRLFGQQTVSESGKYSIQLYDMRTSKWIWLDIDDLIPCKPRPWYKKEAEPLFAQPCGNELWAILLEKAFARFAGSYGALSGGHAIWAWQCMTGVESQFSVIKNEVGEWEQYQVDIGRQKDKMVLGQRRACPLMRTNYDPTYVKDQLFEFIHKCDRKRYLMGAGISNAGGVVENIRTDGLVEGHSYTLISVHEIEGIKLVELRNPWGNDKEWTGAWSDNSNKWDEYPIVKTALNPALKPDGAFWMSFEDFERIFTTIDVCPTEDCVASKLDRLATTQKDAGDQFKNKRQKIAKEAPHFMETINSVMCGAKKNVER